MKKIAILGGSFDPVHNGHLAIAIAAKKELHVDEVWFLLSANTPLKDRTLSAYSKRKKMLDMALSHRRDFKVSTIEKYNSDKNYTIDTIRSIKRMYPKDEFYFLLGADQVEQLDKWKDVDKLQSLITLCVVARKGYKLTTNYNVIQIPMDEVNVSSSEIRGGNVKEVHPKVVSYMMQQGLYPEMLRYYMSEYRYEHSLSVANVAKQLARIHNLDEDIAYISGLYHDINKEFKAISLEDSKKILSIMYPKLLEIPQGIWHGYLGAFVCRHVFGVRNRKVLHAIEHHVLGDGFGVYDKLLYLADKLEPTRQKDTTYGIKLAKQSIQKAYEYVKEEERKIYEKE